MAQKINGTIAAELGVKPWQVAAAVGLLDGGATVPFIARYRKEVTGTLDDTQLRELEERLRYLRELEDRRGAVLKAIEEQGALTDQLRDAVVRAATKAELEDLYLPYKSKRRTKAQIAREAGLEPLADALIADPSKLPEDAAAAFVSDERGVPSAADALAGARAILTERVGQSAELVAELRERLWKGGSVAAAAVEGVAAELAGKYADYADYVQPIASLPGHRVLALLRGEREGALTVSLAEADPRDEAGLDEARAGYEAAVAHALGVRGAANGPAAKWLAQTVRIAWRGRLQPRLETDLRGRLFEAAEEEAVRVFAANLRDVLLAAPAGNRAVLGLDPGLRTGVKVAVVDGTGKVVDTATIYPHAPANKWNDSLASLEALAAKHGIELVAVGNGTASRETDRLAGELLARLAERTAGGAAAARKPAKVIVSEAGASVYSASALASKELPDLDVSLRGAVSIARRLQDPLAELVKIEPKSIGVGQYQHDLTPAKLDRSLDAVVEDCVNAVGVDVNTASPSLLARVAGVGPLLSRSIVDFRDANGPFASRAELKKVPRLGAKAFEQCAGFLRVTGGSEPLDASAVHPEAYGLAHRILAAAGVRASDGAASAGSLGGLDPASFVDERFGLPTVRDVMAELVRPGRDPRPEFVTAALKEGVETIGDLKPGMILEGTVSNVAAFGAFVDLGVHQDGLVHVSAMSSKYVSDPREVVKSGQVVRVKVIDVDVPRRRISLSLRLDDEVAAEAGEPGSRRAGQGRGAQGQNGEQQDGEQRGGGDRRRPRPGGDGGERGQTRSREGNGRQSPARGGQGRQGEGRRPADSAPDTALADALRRAGLTR
ncbi:Tex family protein [Sinomonas sp. ASV322]|uniref:Tex family protein n=1 Tax=Sinomonas sp. ASV322 TaxID=3041920 RepID=UPI0027DE8E0E|nr:Tex family protein [Sinomonas sp. ASV322]MDQ4504050.1 Tex family protein [Sinomonas sp. ASV322]